MSKKLPPDAFEAYLTLGPARSYAALAEQFGVCKRTVVARAKAEGWQEKVVERERQARQQAEKKAVESLAEMNERHLKIVRLIQGKAIEALRSMPLNNASAAAKALAAAVTQERVIRGEPGEHSTLDIVTIMRQEYASLVLKPGDKDDWSANDG